MNDKPFIVIEGIDKTGKSTIARLICEKKNYQLYEYPNRTTPIGNIISTFLKEESYPFYEFNNQSLIYNDNPIFNNINKDENEKKNKNELSAEVANLLFSANRYESANSIRNRKTGIVTARYKYSGFGSAHINNLNMEWVRMCDKLLPEPTHLFFIDSNFEEVKERDNDIKKEIYEKENNAKLFYKYLKEECKKYNAIILEGGHSINYYVDLIINILNK